MPVDKHRNDQLFVAPVTIQTQKPSAQGGSSGGGVAVSSVPESSIVFDRIRYIRHLRVQISELLVDVLEADDFGGSKICDLPDSNILILGAEANLSLDKDGTGILAATDLVVGIGSAVASNSTLSGTMIDVLTAALTADVDPAIFAAHTHDGTPALAFIDDGAAAALFLNVAAAIVADGSVTASGTVDIFYIDTGNVTS